MAKSDQRFLWKIILIITPLIACVPASPEVPSAEAAAPIATPENTLPAYWIPSLSDSFQWQLSDYPIDLSIAMDIYDIDLFEAPQNVIEFLHEAGKNVICYINVGAWERYRPDAGEFPAEVIGKQYQEWPGERWLDIGNYEIFSGLISARFDLAASKGCDGIEPDNINGFQEDTGFTITVQDQLAYNIWLSQQAHLRGLSIGLKNDNHQATDLVDHFDFAILEDCAVFDECADFLPFIERGKAVFQVEYTDNFGSGDDFCPAAAINRFYGILKNRELDAWIEPCPSAK